MKVSRHVIGNSVGAFADGAILFPLLATLSAQNGISATALLATAGLAYWISGLIFRVPMSVQPLKSIAIAALAVGATSTEVRISGAALGLVCLFIIVARLDRFASRVPSSLVHGIQLSLGLILLQQGFKIAAVDSHTLLQALVIAAILVGASSIKPVKDWPLFGMVALAGLLIGTFYSPPMVVPPLHASASDGIRWEIILSLVLPQVALTAANSVLGTRDVANRYFGEAAYRVTVRRLLQTIGIGNLLSAVVGGLPFCHGAGGVTAHYRGGARSWWSNAVIGSFLLLLAAFHFSGGRVILGYPPVLLGALLAAIGVFHFRLAEPSWKSEAGGKSLRFQLVMMGAVVLLTRNMLAALAVGIVFEWGRRRMNRDSIFRGV